MAWSFRTTPKRFLSHRRFLWEVLYCIAEIARLSKIINYFSSASLLLLVSTSSINNNNHYIHDVVKRVNAGPGQVCVRADRSNKRVWFITSSSPPPSVPVNNGFFSYFFSPSLPPYYPPECYAASPSTDPDIFVPCRRPFVVFLSSAGFRSYRHTSGKTPPAVSCCRRAIKDNRNISVIFFPFSALSWDVFEWAQPNRVSRATT